MSADFVKTYVKEMAEKPDYYVEPTEQEILPEDVIVVEDPKESRRQHILTMAKCVSLDDMGLHPLTNPKELKDKKKKELISICQSYIDKVNDDINYETELKSKFADVCNDKIFFEKYEDFPVYIAPHQTIENVETMMDIAGNVLEVKSMDITANN